jgi:hypothetical protein
MFPGFILQTFPHIACLLSVYSITAPLNLNPHTKILSHFPAFSVRQVTNEVFSCFQPTIEWAEVRTLKVDAEDSLETVVNFYQTMWRRITENSVLPVYDDCALLSVINKEGNRMRTSENQTRISGPETAELQKDGANCTLRSFTICTICHILFRSLNQAETLGMSMKSA